MAKLHGYTRITLRNPISGNILKDIESENTFQGSKIAMGMKNLGTTNSSILQASESRQRALWAEYVGGIFLFQNSITEGDSYMSAGNKMIGNGSWNITNGQEPNELGSFNSVESSASASAITQVYDFSTQQANGQISCVALTSRIGGLIGYGNPSGETYTAQAGTGFPQWDSFVELPKSVNPLEAQDGGHRILIGNMYYRFDYDNTTKKVTVHKYHVPLTQGSVFDWIDDDSVELDVSAMHYQNIFVGSFNDWRPRLSEGKIYFINQEEFNIAVGGTMYYIEYNPANDTITEKTFTNSMSTALTGRYINMAHGLLFFNKSSNYKVEVFNAQTSVHVSTLEFPEDSLYNNGANGGEMPNGLVSLTGNTSSNGVIRNVSWLYDPTNDTLYPTNASQENIGYEYTGPLQHDGIIQGLWVPTRYGMSVRNNPLYLATINNLQSPVTKTAAQTMKVTYTLTEA